MGKRAAITLYFIRGAVPTEEQQDEIEDIKGQVRLRNALYHDPKAALEEFDAVAGLVPAEYLAAADEKARKAAEDGEDAVVPPASSSAPAAPQQTASNGAPANASAKPKPAPQSAAWKPNA